MLHRLLTVSRRALQIAGGGRGNGASNLLLRGLPNRNRRRPCWRVASRRTITHHRLLPSLLLLLLLISLLALIV